MRRKADGEVCKETEGRHGMHGRDKEGAAKCYNGRTEHGRTERTPDEVGMRSTMKLYVYGERRDASSMLTMDEPGGRHAWRNIYSWVKHD